MGEDEGEAPKVSPAMANATLSGLSRTTSSKLAKLLGKEYDEQQQQARDQRTFFVRHTTHTTTANPARSELITLVCAACVMRGNTRSDSLAQVEG